MEKARWSLQVPPLFATLSVPLVANPEQPRGGPDSFREQVHGGITRLGGCTLKNHRRNTSS